MGDLLVEDQKIRKYLKKTLYSAGVPKIEARPWARGRIRLMMGPGVANVLDTNSFSGSVW